MKSIIRSFVCITYIVVFFTAPVFAQGLPAASPEDVGMSGERLVRLNAVIVLDEIDEHARSAVPSLEKARRDKQNKYVARVANRALNELLGTNQRVK